MRRRGGGVREGWELVGRGSGGDQGRRRGERWRGRIRWWKEGPAVLRQRRRRRPEVAAVA